jgi:hypothetical protein
MHRYILIAALLGTAPYWGLQAQSRQKLYASQELAMNFSMAGWDAPAESADMVLRWAPVLNLHGHTHYDFATWAGIYAGLGIQNTGFIASFPGRENDARTKFRTYNAGLPIGLKIGKLDQEQPLFFFGGYELELPLHYKEKRFEGNERVARVTAWFTNRTPATAQALFAGVQLPGGTAIKFKYYLTNFFNPRYRTFVPGDVPGETIEVRPFEGIEARVFTIAISYYPFQDLNHWWRKETERERQRSTIAVRYP